MATGLNELKQAIRLALREREADVAHRTHWRDESTAKLREDLKGWGLDPSDVDQAAAFLAGVHYMRLIALAALDTGRIVSKDRVRDWMTEALLVAGERLEAVEFLHEAAADAVTNSGAPEAE